MPPHKPATQTRKPVNGGTSGKCWLCNDGTVKPICVLRKKDQKLLDMYYEMRLLPTSEINSSCNRITLCSCCQRRFHEDPPAWIFLPTDLETILEAEKQFQQERNSDARNGSRRQRLAPKTGDTHKFKIYQTRENGVHKDDVLVSSQIKDWKISPVVSIIHSAEVLYKHVRLDSENYGIPEDVAQTLYDLLFLYGKPAPKVVERFGAREQDAGEQDAGEQDADEQDTEEQGAEEQGPEEQGAEEHGVGQERGAVGSNNKRSRPRDSGFYGGSSPPATGAAPTNNTGSPEGIPQNKRLKPSSSQSELVVGRIAGKQHATSSRQPRRASQNPGGERSGSIIAYLEKLGK